MKQNKYDDPHFFERYSTMARSQGGLEEAGEWPAFRALLPPLEGKRVLDLGCGFGWHCRYAAEQGAREVIGIDLSEKMLARARETTDDPRVAYRRLAIEDFEPTSFRFDLILSSLAFHYVEGFAGVCRTASRCLVEGGWFVFSVEHPIFTASGTQDWCYDDGRRQHWPVDRYLEEGRRATNWLAEDVVKYHRTIETYVTDLVTAGFSIRRLCEPRPEERRIREHPQWEDETRRPMFLLVSAVREGTEG